MFSHSFIREFFAVFAGLTGRAFLTRPVTTPGGRACAALVSACVGSENPAMDTLDYWTPADALALRCPVAAVGTLRPAAPRGESPAGIREDVDLARAHAPRALRALVRIMEAGESRASLEAAKELLLRAYGPALDQTPPAPAPVAPVDGADPRALPAPPWLETDKRHNYQSLNG